MALSKRERSLVGLAVVGAALIGGYVWLIEPLREQTRETAELVPAREAKLDRRRLMIAQRGALEAELAEANRKLETERARLLQGPTPPLAASELQKLVKDVAGEAGVEVRSERILPTADREGLTEVPLEITVAGGIRESVDLLYRLDRTPKLLTVQDLKVRVISVGQPKDLLTTITVSGYLLGSPQADKAADKPPERAPERTDEGGKAGPSRPGSRTPAKKG